MDLPQRALQTNGKLFFEFRIRFRIIGWKPKNTHNIQRITRLGLCKRGGGGICANQVWYTKGFKIYSMIHHTIRSIDIL